MASGWFPRAGQARAFSAGGATGSAVNAREPGRVRYSERSPEVCSLGLTVSFSTACKVTREKSGC